MMTKCVAAPASTSCMLHKGYSQPSIYTAGPESLCLYDVKDCSSILRVSLFVAVFFRHYFTFCNTAHFDCMASCKIYPLIFIVLLSLHCYAQIPL